MRKITKAVIVTFNDLMGRNTLGITTLHILAGLWVVRVNVNAVPSRL
jgi:hypothetical protein